MTAVDIEPYEGFDDVVAQINMRGLRFYKARALRVNHKIMESMEESYPIDGRPELGPRFDGSIFPAVEVLFYSVRGWSLYPEAVVRYWLDKPELKVEFSDSEETSKDEEDSESEVL